MEAQVIEGTWEEVMEQAGRLAQAHPGERVRLVVSPNHPPRGQDVEHFYRTASPDEFARALDAIAVRDRDLPVLPPEAFERESIYNDLE